MAWDLDTDRPIYAQLVERLQIQIVSGYYRPGGKLPSVRELASIAAVNPNTMQKAFTELERNGLIVTQSTIGRMVTTDTELISNTRLKLAKDYAAAYCSGMKKLGYTESEALELIGTLKGTMCESTEPWYQKGKMC